MIMGLQTLTASSTQEADSLITLIEGYYRLMVNQYKQLLRGMLFNSYIWMVSLSAIVWVIKS